MGGFIGWLRVRIVLFLIVLASFFLFIITMDLLMREGIWPIIAIITGILTLLVFGYGMYYWRHKHAWGNEF